MDSKMRDLLSAAAEYVERFGEITEAPADSDCWNVTDQLRAAYTAESDQPGDHWANDHTWSPAEWQQDVANGDTRLGYADWVAHNRETAADEERDGMGNRLDGAGELEAVES